MGDILEVDYELAFEYKDHDVYPVVWRCMQEKGFEWFVCPTRLANLPYDSRYSPHFRTKEEALKYVDEKANKEKP